MTRASQSVKHRWTYLQLRPLTPSQAPSFVVPTSDLMLTPQRMGQGIDLQVGSCMLVTGVSGGLGQTVRMGKTLGTIGGSPERTL